MGLQPGPESPNPYESARIPRTAPPEPRQRDGERRTRTADTPDFSEPERACEGVNGIGKRNAVPWLVALII
jgi:hypothetical protein